MTKRNYVKHGLAHHPLYKVWGVMKHRCNNPNHIQYKDWGGRGVKVCNEWSNNAGDFIKWCLTNGYKKGLAIDRINNDGDYEPSNCRFITQAENNRNGRNAKLNWGIVKEIRKIKLPASKTILQKFADKHEVSVSTISNILYNDKWKV